MQKREQSNLFLTLDALVSLDHPYRNLDRLLPFNLQFPAVLPRG